MTFTSQDDEDENDDDNMRNDGGRVLDNELSNAQVGGWAVYVGIVGWVACQTGLCVPYHII
jgi:hypothetical protein